MLIRTTDVDMIAKITSLEPDNAASNLDDPDSIFLWTDDQKSEIYNFSTLEIWKNEKNFSKIVKFWFFSMNTYRFCEIKKSEIIKL